MTSDLPPAARAVLEEARQAHVAIEPLSGPHITPALFAWSNERLWIAGAVKTLKAKTFARKPVAGLSIAVARRTLLLHGPVERFDPSDPSSIISQVSRVPALAGAFARYSVRNAPDLLAFAADLTRGKLGMRLPPLRAVFAVRPDRGALIEDGSVVSSWGEWTLDSSAGSGMPAQDERSVVVATPGPVALPAFASPSGDHIRLGPGLTSLLPDSERFPIAWVSDEYVAPGPAAKRGLLGRGIAERTPTPSLLRIQLDRLVQWDGTGTSTTRSSTAPAK